MYTVHCASVSKMPKVVLVPHIIIVIIIGFNESGSQGEVMRRGTVSHKWVKV